MQHLNKLKMEGAKLKKGSKSQIAPLREVSILIDILMGSFLLSEGLGRQIIIAA